MSTQPWTSRILDFGFENIDLWRSEEMNLVQLMIPSESAHDTLLALGQVGVLQFKDLNADKSAFQRTFASQVKRCDEMARRLRFFHEQVEKAGVEMKAKPIAEKAYEFDDLENKLEELEKELLETNGNMERLQRSYAELVELQQVLEKAGSFFDSTSTKFDMTPESFDQGFASAVEAGDAPLLDAAGVDKVAKVGFVAGTIQQEKLANFERLLFRATRGNMLLRQVPIGSIMDPATGEQQHKHVFVVFFAGERSRQKVNKICEAFSANRYPFPEDTTRQRQMHAEVSGRLRELHTTNEAGERRRDQVLQDIALSLEEWTTLVRREKAIYHTMNKLSVDVTSKVLIAEAWVPTYAKQQVQELLHATGQSSHTQVSAILQPLVTAEPPPTFYRTTNFTSCFQNIVDAYGIARYREVNPAVLTLMTFPFLFAIMFGDVGHGLLMLLFGAFMIKNEAKMMKQNLGDMVGMLFGGRYCILLMSIYSLYTGFLYNEFFSMPMTIFGGTRWTCYDKVNGAIKMVDPRDCKITGGELKWTNLPYVFGIDPIWHGRKTELPYFNSLKMKMSIIIGVIHMDMGILMSLFNNMHFRDTLSTVCEFIPQIIFLNLIFGYLGILIVAKWVTGATTDLYHLMIYMFLSPGSIEEGHLMYKGQGGLQAFILLVSFVAVPWMLLPKPLILKKRHEALQKLKGSTVELASSYGAVGHDDPEENRRPGAAAHGGGHGGGHGDHGHGEFEFGEVMVHQMIHTIEFVLGAVSNTASYLRLWALSLAHSQLSSVFFDRVLMFAISKNNVIMIFIGFFVFAAATLGVLMVMESLSAFLHALRLHWVEYMNKFYKGDGYKFAPFTTDPATLAQDDDK